MDFLRSRLEATQQKGAAAVRSAGKLFLTLNPSFEVFNNLSSGSSSTEGRSVKAMTTTGLKAEEFPAYVNISLPDR